MEDNDDLNTCLNFIRQAREELQDNRPVVAYNILSKVEEYAKKTHYTAIKNLLVAANR